MSPVCAAGVEVEKGLGVPGNARKCQEMPGNAKECQTAPGVRIALLNFGAKLQQNLFSSLR